MSPRRDYNSLPGGLYDGFLALTPPRSGEASANISLARPQDYKKATGRIYRSATQASHVELPLLPLEP